MAKPKINIVKEIKMNYIHLALLNNVNISDNRLEPNVTAKLNFLYRLPKKKKAFDYQWKTKAMTITHRYSITKTRLSCFGVH